MLRMKKLVPSAVSLCLATSIADARDQPKGYINNIDGEECWFTQITSKESYFHNIPGNTGNLVFDDPTCMAADDLSMGVNQMMISNFIVRPYSHDDAMFQTRPGEFFSSSDLQVRGICIQSATYPGIGVVAEFQVREGFILGVKHAWALQGCKNK